MAIIDLLVKVIKVWSLSFLFCICFGSPFKGYYTETSILATYFCGVLIPLIIRTKLPISRIIGVLSTFKKNSLNQSNIIETRLAQFTFIGAWFGCFVIPLDWDKWWQAYPLPALFGQIIEYNFPKVIPTNPGSPKLISPSTFLEGIIFFVFDNRIGPIVKHQVPGNILDLQFVNDNSVLVIPKDDFMGKMLKFNSNGITLMGRPIAIKDDYYERSKFMFNCCLAIKEDSTAEFSYSSIVRKISEYLEEMEVESRCLSSDNFDLEGLLKKIYKDLTEKGQCVHSVNAGLKIYLKPDSNLERRVAPIVDQYMVPIFNRLPPPTKQEQLCRMDLLCKKICPLIDGINTIKEIADEVEIDVDLVIRCIKNLHVYGYVTLLPLFMYRNCYTQTESIADFRRNDTLKNECLAFIKLNRRLRKISFDDVYRLYLSLSANLTVRQWCIEFNPRNYGIDERKFIQYGVYRKIITKINTYPIALNPNDKTEIAGFYMSNSKPILYSYWRSSCSWRVRIALNLKNIDYEYKAVNLLKQENHANEYLKINSNGFVPTLVIDDSVLIESIAIIEYLNEKYPETCPLLPKSLIDRANVRAITLIISSSIQPIQNIGVLNYLSSDPEKKTEWGKHFITKGFTSLEKMLEKTHGKYCVGDNITIADICIPPQVYNANRFNVDMSKFPIISKINEELEKIEAFRKAHPSFQPDAVN
ncbi:Nitrogen permease regulator 2-like protein [Strongyloides ratti]|uniref:maleylacetoacetate isomerase n=1 Tax=Strongyloides ratti TaxID=34506 RepID=A0A090KUK6_STRRB|nr:Nitrogen permease regulator 2-like protein [Strongyloides ratti]CEF61101.1 Nitrogen permease regulator 2-like protein [Strongyloides ratti]